MRYLIALALLAFCGCSHAYVRQFGNGQVTTCCPMKKLGCKQEKLDKLAVNQCHGPATPISGGTLDSGAQAIYGRGFADVGVTRDSCVTYKCAAPGPFPASIP